MSTDKILWQNAAAKTARRKVTAGQQLMITICWHDLC